MEDKINRINEESLSFSDENNEKNPNDRILKRDRN